MIESFKPAIQALQAQNAPLEESIRPVLEQINANKRLINQLYDRAGLPPLYPEVVDQSTNSAKRVGPKLPDEYMGRALATVVREILEQRKAIGLGAIHMDELYDTMKSGGYVFDQRDAATAKKNTAISLGKNAVFARVNDSAYWGLSEWYPHLKREKSKGAGSPPQAEDTSGAASAPAKTETAST